MASSITFQNAYKMPIIGLGTWQAQNEKEIEIALDAALEAGYKHIDTAYLYNNERVIGKVLKKWFASRKIKRKDLFIVTKLPQIGMTPEKVPHFVKKSLESLQLTYIDLYLIHAPVGFQYVDDETLFPMKDGKTVLDYSTDLTAIWKSLEEEVDAGRIRSLGISNFNESQVERICCMARHKPMNHQVEIHAYFQNKNLRKVCEKFDITVCAFAPFGSPGLNEFLKARGRSDFKTPQILEDPIVVKIGKKYGKSSAQVLLRFLIQQGIAVIPKSTSPERILKNIQIFDFELSLEEMNELAGLDQGDKGRIFSFIFEGYLFIP
ncbi:Aldo-keto reductase family 1 member B10 [Orchesella cincta]|uniref:Aldo-keto reductase family 1 member B10 n=1 Tax=Orchesella cincta TaxID=48709 RepID=A0A1D2MDW9_ORCCI|nr:Aldo-keto reductase family 1 member B10 [Orchesella cincta]